MPELVPQRGFFRHCNVKGKPKKAIAESIYKKMVSLAYILGVYVIFNIYIHFVSTYARVIIRLAECRAYFE